MITEELLKETQEFAFSIIRDYSLDTEAPKVLLALADVKPVERKQFFDLHKDKSARDIYYILARCGSISKWLECYALVAYINDGLDVSD